MRDFGDWLQDLTQDLKSEEASASPTGSTQPNDTGQIPFRDALEYPWLPPGKMSVWEQAEFLEEENLMPEGVDYNPKENCFEAECCRCGEWKEILCDISEIPMRGFEHYCGGSPHCCP